MRSRLARSAAAAALSLVITEVLAAGSGQPVFGGAPGSLPQLHTPGNLAICYTRTINTVPVFGITSTKLTRRLCLAGERAGNVVTVFTSALPIIP